ncbi:hypothetical protein [Halobacillus litoralis]|uniref:hypothetical protein n=1 Tax=Halobacillus litoralis TaxID=45668 RepID=UPI001CFC518B|nr:hypothetical protein [Halobacillus litoralis]
MKSKYLVMSFFLICMFVSGCSNYANGEPPELTVQVGEESISAVKGTYMWETEDLFSNKSVVADAMAPHQIAEDIEIQIVKPGQTAAFTFSDNSSPEVNAYIWEESRGNELKMDGNNVVLPSDKGKYIVEVMARWENGESSYTFVIEVR